MTFSAAPLVGIIVGSKFDWDTLRDDQIRIVRETTL
jgi:hypothetical protein